jgi:hypothetical protein
MMSLGACAYSEGASEASLEMLPPFREVTIWAI